MKIVIDIPDKDYEELKDGHISFSILKVMQNGTPLPKDMQRFDEQTMATAFAYAHYHRVYGIDVTEKWNTATQQSANLEQAYRKGYYDAVERMMALNREGAKNESNN